MVQIVGDGNTVLTGHAYLTLERRPPPPKPQGVQLLDPTTRGTPLRGRDAELADLRQFVTSDGTVLVRVLIGQGGSGKTRLALHLCDELSVQDWQAGFVSHIELRRFVAQHHLAQWGWQRPTLVVVDYAAGGADALATWLHELIQEAPSRPPLRLLLLEREASTESGWWQRVFDSQGWSSATVKTLLSPREPVAVPPLPAAEQRHAIALDLLQQLNPDVATRLQSNLAAMADDLAKPA